ncbi:MAG: potassium channel protein [Acidimicrobiia bacterium]|nr:MAG: potassium channel protein [Acidimicrobiia bacterium]
MHLPHHLKIGLIALITVMVVGSTGFVLIGGLAGGDALYLTIITITTLGFSEIGGPFAGTTRVWVVIVLLSGMGAAFYTLTALIEYGFEVLFGSDHRRRRKMLKELSLVNDHIIICGYGRVGATAAAALRRGHIPVVVIEQRAATVRDAEDAEFLVVAGDATRDEVLLEAGIERARSVIASVASPSDNLVITLSVKALHPGIPVAARAVDIETENKLKLAGADAVVTPELLGGERIAALATQPGLAEFIDTVVRDSTTEFRIKRFVVADRSPSVGRTLSQLDLRKDSGAMVIGVAQEGEPIRMNPDPDKTFEHGDCVLGIGSETQLESLSHLFEDC